MRHRVSFTLHAVATSGSAACKSYSLPAISSHCYGHDPVTIHSRRSLSSEVSAVCRLHLSRLLEMSCAAHYSFTAVELL